MGVLIFILGTLVLGLIVLVFVKVLLALVLLPFKLLGLVGRLIFGVLAGAAGLICGVAVLALVALAVPLLPLVLIGGVIWLIARAGRPGTALARTR
jgi:hypothetical protein